MRAPLQHGSPGAYGNAALQYEIIALARTLPGARNHALNRAAFSLFQLVAGGELNEAEVLNRLIEAAFANGLMSDPNDGPASVKRTIETAAVPESCTRAVDRVPHEHARTAALPIRHHR